MKESEFPLWNLRFKILEFPLWNLPFISFKLIINIYTLVQDNYGNYNLSFLVYGDDKIKKKEAMHDSLLL